MGSEPSEAASPRSPRIVRRSAEEPFRCGCGTRIPPGDSYLRVEGLPPSQRGPFEGRTFCSLACLREFYLETLSVLEAMDTPESQAVVSDLRATYLELGATFSRLLRDWNASWYLTEG